MKIVVALGGNALQAGSDIAPHTQLQVCRKTVKSIVDLIQSGHDIALVHGNGPQVGEIFLSNEVARKADKRRIPFPLDICTAFTQGYIGYHIQSALNDELHSRSISSKKVSTIITQVKVNAEDQAFSSPSKPIGGFYTEEEAKVLQENENIVMMEDAGRGWRRVVPSPKPVDIIEKSVIQQNFETGNIVISCGGGGIPVVQKNGKTVGVEGVIDKDFAASKLAEIINADLLLILTEVDHVYVNFNTPNQKHVDRLSIKDINLYEKQGQFAKGSMLPKVLATKEFVKSCEGKKAIITSLYNANNAIQGKVGTVIAEH